jgi:hypothetical protein
LNGINVGAAAAAAKAESNSNVPTASGYMNTLDGNSEAKAAQIKVALCMSLCLYVSVEVSSEILSMRMDAWKMCMY